jgi:hypothetical protein
MTVQPLRWGPLAALGLVCGLVHVALGIVLYLAGVYFEPGSLRLMTFVLAAYIGVGNWWYGRHVLGGKTSYPKALLVGVVISVTTGLVYAAYNFVTVSFVYSEFLEQMIQAEFARASAGLDTVAAAALLRELRAGVSLGGLMMGNLAAVSRIGTAFSVLIAIGFMGRWRGARVAATARS